MQAEAQLKEAFPARGVILFGSLARQGWFVTDSDVDLEVAGLSSGDYWKAWRLLEDAWGLRPVDLLELETAGASLREAIERYGIEL